MNRGNMLQSSGVQQMLGDGPNRWWRIMPSPSPPPPPSSQDIFSAASSTSHSFPNHLAPPWHHAQDFPESLSELLMGGSVSEEDKSASNHTQQQAKKLENWEEQLLLQHDPQHKSSNVVNQLMLDSAAVKQENSLNYADFYCFKPNDWPNPMIPVSSPNSCVSSLSSNMLVSSTLIANTANARRPPPDRSSECKSSGNSGGASKKAKIQHSSSNQSTFKVRKEKLGDRITALHQIVSPFGKTDTASVLLEAIGYIRFLQTQVEALSLPYLQDSGSPNMRNRQDSLLDVSCMKMKGSALHLQDSHAKTSKDLRSRGLCLVPVSCTMQVESDNGADYWAPALNGGFRRPD